VILMMETHVAHTFLDTDLRAAPWFEWLDYANGLVAPSFLFIAGFTQGGRWQGGQGKPLSLEGRARRLAGIALLGYGLHFPFSQLWNAEWSEALRLGTQIDVLQCLAVSLFVLLLVTLGAQRLAPPWRGEVWWRVLGALALAVILAAPSVAEWEGGSLPVRALINHSTGSLFPLFSWSAFVFCGALCGEMASRPILVRIGATAAVMALGQILPSLTFSAVSPQFFLERLGWVMMLALFCEWLVPDQASSWVSFAGRESLIMYVGHLTLIFLLATIGLPERELSWPATLGWMGVVMAVTFGLAFAKSRWGAWAEGLVSA
jgi:hypothetical protein